MSGLLEGKSAIITGSSRGIGRAIAKCYAENGARLIIHGTREEALSELKSELNALGAECEYVAGDIGSPDTAARLAEKCLENYKSIDILVNNAGINSRKSFEELSFEDWDNMLRTNLTSAFYTCKAVLPSMLEQGSGAYRDPKSKAEGQKSSYCFCPSGGGRRTPHERDPEKRGRCQQGSGQDGRSDQYAM